VMALVLPLSLVDGRCRCSCPVLHACLLLLFLAAREPFIVVSERNDAIALLVLALLAPACP